MVVTYGVDSFTIGVKDYPDYPITEIVLDGGNYLRSLIGQMYNPSKYKVKRYGFSFTNVSLSLVNNFIDLFEAGEEYFNITDTNWGNVDLIIEPSSLQVGYNIGVNNNTLTFTCETKEAI